MKDQNAIRAVEQPPVPEHLLTAGRRLWAAVVDGWLVDAHQLEILRLACEALDRADEARRVVDAEGCVYADARGFPRKHPAVAVEEGARLQVARLIREMALDVPESPSRPPRRGGQRW